MKTLIRTFILSFILFALPAIAGTDHKHGHSHEQQEPADQATAQNNALDAVASLAKRNKIDASWATKEVSSIEKKKFNDRIEWVVIFNNEKISDASKQTLYIFLTLEGDYIAVNYTGN